MTRAIGYAALDPATPLQPFPFERRALRDNDVSLRIRYCGVCHSDLHSCRNDWGNARYPLVPGHEIVGEVTAVGPAVTRHRVGDRVAVGCLVDSCMACPSCEISHEHQCEAGSTGTYNGKDRVTGELTLGGYSDHIRHGENGFLFETTQQAVRILADLKADPALRAAVGGQARKTVEELFSPQALRQRLDFYLR